MVTHEVHSIPTWIKNKVYHDYSLSTDIKVDSGYYKNDGTWKYSETSLNQSLLKLANFSKLVTTTNAPTVSVISNKHL